MSNDEALVNKKLINTVCESVSTVTVTQQRYEALTYLHRL